MARILTVGIATLDLVFKVDHYPEEDEEMRATSLRVVRGGNAGNTAVVLAQLGHQVSFAGVLADAPETQVIRDDFGRYGVDIRPTVLRAGTPPTSSILVAPSGTRTIVHYRDLAEFAADDFGRIDLTPFDWIHFEGRNIPALGAMVAHVRAANARARISLEAEKPRDGLESVLALPDVLLCSRALARHFGCASADVFLEVMRGKAPHADIYVGWGISGAFAQDRRGISHRSPAFPPGAVVDSVGAGDTFNAGVIDGYARGLAPSEILLAASHLAGRKCGRVGFGLG
jgi:ketohexokinase